MTPRTVLWLALPILVLVAHAVFAAPTTVVLAVDGMT
jgi:hypothetical protein